MRRVLALVAFVVVLVVGVPLVSQQSWGTWTTGAGAFGSFHWGPPQLDLDAFEDMADGSVAGQAHLAALDGQAAYLWYWREDLQAWARAYPSPHGESHEAGAGDELLHGSLAELSEDDHAQYALLAGRAGGESLTGINALSAMAPAQQAASQAGQGLTISASAATAGASSAGAAAGGALTFDAGDAARLTSGNAAGGDIVLEVSAGIGTGRAGLVHIKHANDSASSVCFGGTLTSDGNTACLTSKSHSGTPNFQIHAPFSASLGRLTGKGVWLSGSGNRYVIDEDKDGVKAWRDSRYCWVSDNSNAADGTCDLTLSRPAAAVLKIDDALRLNPRADPPVTCGAANSEGVVYSDSTGSKAYCWCDGAAWVVVAGAGACA